MINISIFEGQQIKGFYSAVFDLIKYYLKDERKERMSIAGASIDNPLSTSLRNNIGFPDHIKRVLDMYKIYS